DPVVVPFINVGRASKSIVAGRPNDHSISRDPNRQTELVTWRAVRRSQFLGLAPIVCSTAVPIVNVCRASDNIIAASPDHNRVAADADGDTKIVIRGAVRGAQSLDLTPIVRATLVPVVNVDRT